MAGPFFAFMARIPICGLLDLRSMVVYPLSMATKQSPEISYDTKTIITVLSLFSAYPLGLIFMFKWMKWPQWLKVIIFLPVIVFVFVVFVMFLATLSGAIR